jgi:hypothetical protein
MSITNHEFFINFGESLILLCLLSGSYNKENSYQLQNVLVNSVFPSKGGNYNEEKFRGMKIIRACKFRNLCYTLVTPTKLQQNTQFSNFSKN